MDFKINMPFFVNVFNFKHTPVHLTKHHCICLIDPDLDDTEDITEITQDILETISGVQEPEVITDNPKHCTDTFNREDRGDSQRGAILALLMKHKTMCTGHLETTKTGAHHISFYSPLLPLYAVPYTTGPTMRQEKV